MIDFTLFNAEDKIHDEIRNCVEYDWGEDFITQPLFN